MPTVLPPEWDSMSAKEQTIWYLASWIEKIEGMTAELAAATSRLDSAASSVHCPEPAVHHQLSLDTTNHVAVVSAPASSYTDKYVLVEATPDSTPTSAHDPQSLGCPQESAAKEPDATSDDAIAELTPPSTPSAVSLGLTSTTVGDADHGAVVLTAGVSAPPLIPLVAHPAQSAPVVVFSSLSLPPDAVHQAGILAHVRRSAQFPTHSGSRVQPVLTQSYIASTCILASIAYLDPAGPLLHRTPTAHTGHGSHGIHLVVESKVLLQPPLQRGTEPQPWPPPVHVHNTEEVIILFCGITCSSFTNNSGYVWWPPDHQPRRSRKLQGWMVHTQLGTLFVIFVDLQPWPSWNEDVVHDWEFTSFAGTRVHVWLDSRISVTNCGATEAVSGCLKVVIVSWSGTKIHDKEYISTFSEQQWPSQLPFHIKQSEGCGCMTWHPGELVNHSLLWRNTDDQQYGFNLFHLVQVRCKVIADSERSSLNHRSRRTSRRIPTRSTASLMQPLTWASSFSVEKLWSTNEPVYITQIVSMTVHWQFSSHEGFKECLGFALRRAALTHSHIGHCEYSTEIVRINQVTLPTIGFNYLFFEEWLTYTLAPMALQQDKLLITSGMIVVPNLSTMTLQMYSCYTVRQLGASRNGNLSIMKLQMSSTEASETCECQHLISTEEYHQFWDYFEVGSGPTYPKADEDNSVQHRMISTYVDIYMGGTQCKYLCSSASCLFGKWLLEAGNQQDGNVYRLLQWKFKDAPWYGGTSIRSSTLVVCGAMPYECMPPVRVRNGRIRHMFRPRPWPSFKFHLDASYQEEPCCRVQSQEVAEWCAHLYAFTEFYLEKFACCCPIVPRDIPNLSKPILQYMGGLYLSVVVALLCECPLSSGREFVAGAMTISIEKRITREQSSWSLSSSYLDAHHVKFLNWYSLHCHYSGALPNSFVATGVEYSISEVHKSWDPGDFILPASHIRLSKTLILMVGSKGVGAMDGMAFFANSDQEHFQGGRDVIAFTVTDDFVQGSVDHRYYLGFDQGPADNDYFLGLSFNRVFVGDSTKSTSFERNGIRAGVGLGSSRISRRGECQGPCLTSPPTGPSSAQHNGLVASYIYLGGGHELDIEWITATAAAAPVPL